MNAVFYVARRRARRRTKEDAEEKKRAVELGAVEPLSRGTREACLELRQVPSVCEYVSVRVCHSLVGCPNTADGWMDMSVESVTIHPIQ